MSIFPQLLQLTMVFYPLLFCHYLVLKIQQIVFTERAVTSDISKPKSNLSGGPDGLPPLFFKHTCSSIAGPLAMMFTQMMSVSSVPDDGKAVTIVPVYKTGLATDVRNYRPISLTCVSTLE